MQNIKKEDINEEIFIIYNDYAHNRISRRAFMQKLSLYAVGGLTVPALLSFLSPDYQSTLQVAKDDPDIQTDYITYSSPKGGGEIKGLLAVPVKITKKLGAVVVVHENRGLNPYIEDVARRAAKAGFLVLAPDALTPLGGYPGNDDDGRELQAKREGDSMLEDFIAAANYLSRHERSNGKVGVVGFCFGGWISNMMAARMPNLKAAVPFYGRQAPLEEVPNIKAPLLLQFAEQDEGVNKGWPAYEKTLKANNKKYTAHSYPGTHHGFHNDSTPRFDPQAAQLAWDRTIEFFNIHLA
ncbi:dienelactone hydrolase family protein [Sphingobacterium shayense]|uniref:dienelactone hydrolase family protein n=1 Tax=Sphingobacterium shayense TaxID=626343 RepID=UPI001557E4C2|nr:dienelactone hydrolase family protein [Sphingobacterium shayense]NQD71942.1 dienelactone hydrolase family protein [Sphingobacterium shayense]